MVVAVLHGHGGQVLKFLGDGVLAVFPAGDGEAEAVAACARAASAAHELQQRLAAWSAARAARGAPGATAGVGLHFGEVTYGNVGAPDRLDFTVIGADVNLAARVEALCATTGSPVLNTGAVAGRLEGWNPMGAFALKGEPDEIPVFRPLTP